MPSQVASKVLTLGALAVFAAVPIQAQQRGTAGAGSAPSTSPGASAGSAGTINRNPTNPNPTANTRNNWPGTQQGMARPIFISGRVVTDDGSPVDSEVRIERVCGSQVHLEAHVDSKGRFSFQLGGNSVFDTDASTQNSYSGSPYSSSAATSSGLAGSGMGYPGAGINGLAGCIIRATFPGYHSDEVELANRHSLDSPDVGTIVLHHVGKVEGTTMSVTTLAAPKPAKKAYEKSSQLAQKGKLDEAVDRLTEATSIYPQYAIAWEALGELQQREGHLEAAETAFQSAIKADSHYVSPYQELAFLYGRQQKWQESADASERAISLNPVEFPAAFWYNAVANYNLKRAAQVQKSLEALIKLDTQHRFKQADKLLAQALMDQSKPQEAAAHLRTYLALSPEAPDAAALQQVLARIEQSAPASPESAQANAH